MIRWVILIFLLLMSCSIGSYKCSPDVVPVTTNEYVQNRPDGVILGFSCESSDEYIK